MADKDMLVIFQCLRVLMKQSKYVGWPDHSTIDNMVAELDDRIIAIKEKIYS